MENIIGWYAFLSVPQFASKVGLLVNDWRSGRSIVNGAYIQTSTKGYHLVWPWYSSRWVEVVPSPHYGNIIQACWPGHIWVYMDLILTYTDIPWLWNILGTNHALFLDSGVLYTKIITGGPNCSSIPIRGMLVMANSSPRSPRQVWFLWPLFLARPTAEPEHAALLRHNKVPHGAMGQRGNGATAATFLRKQRWKWESGRFFLIFIVRK